MKKLIASILLATFAAHASLLTLSLTNSLGLPDTNSIKVIQADTNAPTLTGGNPITIGFPSTVTPDTNGTVKIFRMVGNYVLYGPTLGSGLLYRFPDSSSNSTAYALSGFNTFQTVVQIVSTNGGGTNSGSGIPLVGGTGIIVTGTTTNTASVDFSVVMSNNAAIPVQTLVDTNTVVVTGSGAGLLDRKYVLQSPTYYLASSGQAISNNGTVWTIYANSGQAVCTNATLFGYYQNLPFHGANGTNTFAAPFAPTLLYGGAGVADAANLTNLNATALAGIVPTNNLPMSQLGSSLPAGVVTNLVLRPNGTNDSTAVIQAAFSTPNSVVYFTPGNYYATNLWLTSNIVVLGNGSTLYQLATASQFPYSTNTDWINNTNWNALINCGNLPVNQSIYNLKLDGMKPANYEAFNFPIWTGTNNGFYTLGADGNYAATNNFGLIINEAAGGEVSGCTAQNFGGAGYFIASSYDQLSYLTARTAFHDNSSYSNFCGFYVQSWGGTHPNFFGNAEYAEQHDLVANNCAIGGDFGASNEQVHDSALNYNYIGMVVVGGNGNSGPHTRTHHMNLNHNYCGFWIGPCDFLAVDNLYAAINTTNFIKNGYKIQFNDSSFGNCWFDNQGYLGYTTNLVTFQGGGELFNIASTGGNMDFESTLIGGLISFTNANVNAFNNVAMYPFTNWTWTVITNLGGGTYNGNNNHLFNGTQTDNGTFTGTFAGNGSGLSLSGTTQTNMNLVSSLNGTTAVSVNGAQLVDAAGNQALNWNSHAFPNGWNDAGATNYSADALNNTASHHFNATNAANVFSGSFAGNGSGLTNYYVFDTSISNVTFNLVSGQYTVWKPIGLNTLYLVGNGTTNTVFGTQIVPVITVGTNFYLGN